MKTETEPWYVSERAVNLAIVLLTSRDDLAVNATGSAMGVDLLVTIHPRGGQSGRVFGVIVKGVVDLSSAQPLRIQRALLDVPFPLCQFIFDVRSTEGYFRWILEPTVARQARSLREGKSQLVPIDDECLDQIVRRINEWYDALRINGRETRPA
jgi:hypothetical protein